MTSIRLVDKLHSGGIHSRGRRGQGLVHAVFSLALTVRLCAALGGRQRYARSRHSSLRRFAPHPFSAAAPALSGPGNTSWHIDFCFVPRRGPRTSRMWKCSTATIGAPKAATTRSRWTFSSSDRCGLASTFQPEPSARAFCASASSARAPRRIAGQGVVGLVAGILEHLLRRTLPGRDGRPWRGPCGWVIDGHLVAQRIRVARGSDA